MTTNTDPQPDPISPISAGETFDSFNKFDEIAVVKAFGQDVYALRDKPFDFLRCLAFTHQRRLGLDHDKAREYAFNLTIKQLGTYFPKDETADELDPDDPETDEGKGDSLTGV